MAAVLMNNQNFTGKPYSPEALSPVAGMLPDLSLIDFPGRIAAVLFTAGCNFRCPYCHNGETLNGPARSGMTWRDLDAALARHRQNWVDAVVITGGEPTLQSGLPDLVAHLKAQGFAIKLDTNGTRPDVVRALLPRLSYVAMDIKCTRADYPRRVGCPEALLPRLDETIELLKTHAPDYEFRTTVLPDWHPAESWSILADWLAGAKRYILQAFIPRPQVLSPALRTAPETPLAFLRKMRAALEKSLPSVEIRGTF